MSAADQPAVAGQTIEKPDATNQPLVYKNMILLAG